MTLIITFKTTSHALAWEKMCKEESLPGRLAPVPRAVTAGCGYAWAANPQDKELLLRVAQGQGCAYEGVFELNL